MEPSGARETDASSASTVHGNIQSIANPTSDVVNERSVRSTPHPQPSLTGAAALYTMQGTTDGFAHGVQDERSALSQAAQQPRRVLPANASMLRGSTTSDYGTHSECGSLSSNAAVSGATASAAAAPSRGLFARILPTTSARSAHSPSARAQACQAATQGLANALVVLKLLHET